MISAFWQMIYLLMRGILVNGKGNRGEEYYSLGSVTLAGGDR
jgi:hypothetical protein